MTVLKDYFTQKKIIFFEVFVTDRNMELIRTISNVFFSSAHLLCIWHVNKNVLTHCKPAFNISKTWKNFYAAWHIVIQTTIIETFNNVWIKFRGDYEMKYFELVDYLKNIWIRPFADKIIKCHINRIRHFFFTTTSRSEGAHRVLKQQLKFSIEDLKLVIDKIEILLMNQKKDYAIKLDVAKMRVFFDFQISLFRDLISKIFPHALRLIYKQYLLIQKKNYSFICINVWRIISGLFCSHIISKKMRFSIEMILLEDVHSHWHFVKFVNFFVIDFILFVKEPAVAKTRKRFMKSIIESSSQSAFMMKKMKKNTEFVSIIEPQKKIFIQRDFFRFEIVEDIVFEKKVIFIRNKIADRNERARNRNRGRSRNRNRIQNRSRDRNRNRDRNKKRKNSSADARDENERWVRRTADETINETVNQETDEVANEMTNEMTDEMADEMMNDWFE